HRVLRGHHDEERVDVLLARPAEDVEAGEVRHLDVDEGDVVRSGAQRGERLGAARDRGDLVPGLAERALEHPPDRFLVVGDQDRAGRPGRPLRLSHAPSSSLAGSVTRNDAPPPGRGWYPIVPPCSVTIRWQTARPSPRPRGLVEKNGEKSCG